MEKKELQKLLSQPYSQENWKQIVQFVFPNVSIRSTPYEYEINDNYVKKFRQIGDVKLDDGKNLALFELILAENIDLKRNRVGLNDRISKYIDQEGFHGVLSVFDQQGEDYRFTFSSKSTDYDADLEEIVQSQTDKKRFTYVLGKNQSCKTPAERFYSLSQKDEIKINNVIDAFNVENLSKEFFDKYKKQFEKFWKYIDSKDEYNNVFINGQGERKVKIRNFTKKLLGRIVFLHFLQKKGWMGCPENESWGSGDKKFMQTLFKDFTNKDQFHSQCLVELFYNTLNTKRDNFLFKCEGLEGGLNNSKIPYLNGGLFDSDRLESTKIDFPESYFQDLFDFFGQYNFTIDENDPNDHEVGIDPEMLGHIFENLLEDNKDKGAFYTPKVIVRYMCQESLIEYLATKLEAETSGEVKQAIEDLIRNRLAEEISDLDLVEPIAQALFDVKICDPAIGSGAFPMGILNVIYQVIEALYYLQPDSVARVWNISDTQWQPHLVKKNIIQHSIYGVDIESGAVDIARLRFWLALVVDEVEPLPLPNLDYKIMQGNSLLESFEGIDLSQISDAAAYEAVYESEQIDMFSGEAKKKVSMSLKFEDVKTLMDDYFNANDPETKKDLHKRIDDQVLNHIRFTLADHKRELQKKAKKLEKKVGLDQAAARTLEQRETIRTNSKAAKALVKLNTELSQYNDKELKLAQLSNSNERPFFLWHLFFQEVFDKGGFDIVIGNPPYVDSETMIRNNPEERNIYKNLYETASGNWDLFIVFIEKGIKLTNDSGVFSYIIPNKLIGAKYSLKSKEFMSNYSIFDIRDYSRLNVFTEASVYPITIHLSKNSNHNSVNLSKINSTYNVASTKSISYSVFKRDLLWDKYFNDEDVVNVILKLLKNRELREFDKYSILGAATVSEAYLVKQKLIDSNSNLKSFKKFINTGTIDKYQSLWGIKNTQYIKDAYLYPVINDHHIKEINKIRFIQAGSPKIIVAGMSINLEGYLDKNGDFLAGKSTSVIMSNENSSDELMWLLTFLNSKVVSYFLNVCYHSLKMSGGYLNIGNEILKSIPIPNIEKHHKLKLIDIAKKFNDSREEYESQIDYISTEMYIAKLYNLTFKEFKLVCPEISNKIDKSVFSSLSINK